MSVYCIDKNTQYPSYDDISIAVQSMADQLRANAINVDVIIALSRGGLVPGTILSHATNLPLVPVSYSSKQGAGDDKNHGNVLPVIHGEFSSGTGDAPALPTIAIIDDIVDSGNTLKEVRDHYTNNGHTVITLSLYYKESAVIVPDYSWLTIPKNSPFIFFPWEIETSRGNIV